MKLTHTITILLSLVLMASCGSSSMKKSGVKGTYETSLEYEKFIDPPVQFRSFPFYSLNDDLQPYEIKRQVAEFKDAGFVVFYLHSRDGLITDFLGDNWWRVMDAGVEGALENGLQAWFYDEDKWPSGYAGGIIPRMGDEFRAKSLARLKKDTPLPDGSEVIKEDENYRYIMHTAAMGHPKFNGTAWVDLMNPRVVKAFLDVAYQPYIDKYKHRITHYNFGIFADEPHIHARYFDPRTPHQGIYSYSPYVREKFKQLWGYDFADKIDLLFEEKDNWREVRLHYYRAVALQFEESFSKQISDFCEANGILFTGHYLGEDGLEKVRDRIGNSMLHYRNMQQPGIDLLGLGFDGRLITARSLTSVANQYGTPRRMSELFGISGQNMNFQDRKWIAGWHAIMGINHYVPHLTLYSMKGLRKRDYPPTFSYHQPYWQYNKKLEDYLARIAYATSIGEYAPQVLVINPLESEYGRGKADREFTEGVHAAMEQLQLAHIDYDLGDEHIISEIGKINGSLLQIGNMNYAHVILPDMITLRETTVQLLLKLADKGGKIFYSGRFPSMVDGKENPELLYNLLAKTEAIPLDILASELPNRIKPLLRLEGANTDQVWTQVREVKNGKLIQLCNISYTETVRFQLHSELLKANPILWDPALAKCFSLGLSNGAVELELAPASNIWISTGTLSNSAQVSGTYKVPQIAETVLALNNEWQSQRLDPNALTLDFARFSTDGKKFSKPEPVIGIFNRLSDQQYYGPLHLSYSFDVHELPENIRLSVEQPEMYTSILVNGQAVNFEADHYFVDRLFPSANVASLIRKGINVVDMQLDFRPAIDDSETALERYGTEIESIYLFGDFGVKGIGYQTSMNSQRNNNNTFIARPVHGFQSFAITAENQQSRGDVTPEGYPFYAGAFMLTQQFTFGSKEEITNYKIEFPNTEAIAMVVELNGQVLDTLCWAPFETDITSALKEGENILSVKMVNSLRNLMGPHHNRNAEMIKVGPANFTGAGGFPDGRGDRDWYDLRLGNAALRTWTDTYWHIPFGMLEAPKIKKVIGN